MQKWLTGSEAIAYLNVARTTFYKLVKEGTITRYALLGMKDPRYNREELDALYKPVKEET